MRPAVILKQFIGIALYVPEPEAACPECFYVAGCLIIPMPKGTGPSVLYFVLQLTKPICIQITNKANTGMYYHRPATAHTCTGINHGPTRTLFLVLFLVLHELPRI